MATAYEVEEVDVQVGESGPQQPPQDVSAIPLLAGMARSGPFDEPRLISTPDDLAEFEAGNAVALSSNLIARGRVHYLVRVEPVQGGYFGPMTKQYGNPRGAATLVRGALLVDAASPNGRMIAEELVSGVVLEIIETGLDTKLKVEPVKPDNIVQITLATDMTGKRTTTAKQLFAAVAAQPTAAAVIKFSPLTGSDANGIVGVTVPVRLSESSISYRALRRPLTFQHIYTKNVPLKVEIVGDLVKTTIGTDADGTPLTTPFDLIQYIAKNPKIAAEIVVEALGNAVNIVSPFAAGVMPFGSLGSATAFGAPTDRASCVFRVTRAGTVGMNPPPAGRWSLDDADSLDVRNSGGSYSADVPIGADGIVDLSDSDFLSDIRFKFSGPLDENDIFRCEAFGPEPSSLTLLRAIDAAYDNRQIRFGYVVPTVPVSGIQGIGIDSVLQKSRGRPRYRHTYALVGPRDQYDGETIQAYEQALAADWDGAIPVVSLRGRLSLVTNYGRQRCERTKRFHRRPAAWYIAMTRALRPVHEQPGNRNTNSGPGSAANFDFSVFYQDADQRLGLRLNGGATSVAYTPNGWFSTEWVTRAPKNSGFLYGPWMAVIVGTSALLQIGAGKFILDTADSDELGRLLGSERTSIARDIAGTIEPFLFDFKIDGKASADRNPPEYPLVFIPGDYDARSTQQLRAFCQVFPKTFFRRVVIRLNLAVQPTSVNQR